MYLSGNLARSTTSNQQIKWWLDNKGEEKPGVTPANNYLAKKPVRTHIYSREEIEAYTEEKLRYVLDIDEKKDFLDIIKLALALKSSDSLAENQAESEWNPSTWIVRTGHTLLRPRVGKSFLFGRSWL
jgi:hypothetical protein